MGIIVEIRLASLDDVKDIVEIHCSDVDKWYKWVNGRKIEDRYENLSVKDKWSQGGPWMSIETCSIHLNYLLINGQYPLVALINDKVVGELELYIGFERELKIAHIDILWIHKKYRRKGIGKSLVYKAIEIARENNCDKIMVWPEKSAVGFYKKCGLNREEEIISVNILLDEEDIRSDKICKISEFPDKYDLIKDKFLISPKTTSSYTIWLKSRWKYIVEEDRIKEIEGYIPELNAAYIIESMWINKKRGKLILWLNDEKNISSTMKYVFSVAWKNGFRKLNLYIDKDLYKKYIKSYIYKFLGKEIVLSLNIK